MAWWNIFSKNEPEIATTYSYVFEQSATEKVISEPFKSIVKAMIDDRNRFIVQIVREDRTYDTTRYAVLDIDTEEEFFVTSIYCPGLYSTGRGYYGPSWAKDFEIEWAVKTLHERFDKVRARAERIAAARERNRLIEIYA